MRKTMEDFWIKMGWYEYPYRGMDTRVLKTANWQSEWVRVEAIRFLVGEVLKKDPRDMTNRDFKENGLMGVLSNYYNGSPYMALRKAGYKIKPWEMMFTPFAFYKKRKNRISAIRWLVKKIGKNPRYISGVDFSENRLGGLLSYNNIHALLWEAGYEMKPWEMQITPIGFFKEKKNRISALRWLIKKTKKDPRDLERKDFENNCLNGLFHNYYAGSPYLVVRELGYTFKPWEMAITPMGFFKKRKNRIVAVKWLVKKLGKDHKHITARAFKRNGLGGLLYAYYGDSPYEALREAGYKLKPWEMSMAPMGFYDEQKNRITATKWLVKKTKKDPREITQEDFVSNGLGGLMDKYSNSPYRALKEAGYPIHLWEMRITPRGSFMKRSNRIAAVRWLVKKTRKKPENITIHDFRSNGFWGILNHYKGSFRTALRDAGFLTKRRNILKIVSFVHRR